MLVLRHWDKHNHICEFRLKNVEKSWLESIISLMNAICCAMVLKLRSIKGGILKSEFKEKRLLTLRESHAPL